ncbi:PGAP1-domain-containing protein [Calocera cornea HHB12733]|uniref:GPI inositol-deacylase n=1 Tax=Calocera cornea HHB12733 TaxID=1353952 RepID=A0A165CV49_9BASI|nr:PGAP1-domain-containing protein [Calocera cornea HHB12733]
MSWMSPSYRLVPGPGLNLNVSTRLDGRYRLWLYREVGWDADGDSPPSGHPVLFLPGNAGSFKQSRSLASSSTRQYYLSPRARAPAFPARTKPLDVYTLDTAEELSAFSAAPLRAQAEYAAGAVAHILSLYAGQPSPPQDVTLLAHSMGGLVARLLLAASPRPPVRTIIALSTPHAFPPLPISRALENLYAAAAAPLPPDVLFLTICGGAQDTEFPGEMCAAWPPSDPGPGQGLALTSHTTSLPQAWTGVGHREIVWCHQVRWRVARLALELQGLDAGAAGGRAERAAAVSRWFGQAGEGAPAAPSRGAAESESESEPEPEPEASEAAALASGAGTWAVLRPLSPPSPVFACTSAGCARARVATRRMLPHPPEAEAWPRPGEGVGEEEGRWYEEVELPGAGWLQAARREGVAVGRKGAGVSSPAGVLSALFGLDVPIPPPDRPALHRTVSFPRLPTYALLVYRASLTSTGACSVLPPLLSSPPEAHYHPRAHLSPGFFPTHQTGPFLPLPASPSPFQLDIWAGGAPGEACSVAALHVQLDIWASLARALPRYRVLLVAWSLGISALLALLATRAWDSGAPFPPVHTAYAFYLQRVLPALALALWAAACLPLPEGWVIGTAGMVLVSPLAPMLLAAASLLVAVSWGVLWALTAALAGGMSLLRLRPDSSTTGTSRPGGLLRHSLPLALFSLLLVLFVPSQFVFLVAFLLQLLTTARAQLALRTVPSPPARHLSHQQAQHAQAQHLLLMLAWLLPLTAPFAVAWARNLPSRGLELVLPSERDPLAVVCAVLALEAGSAGRVWDRARGPCQRWGTAGLLAGLGAFCFLGGARYTYGIYEAVECYFLAALFRPAVRREGECQASLGAKQEEEEEDN